MSELIVETEVLGKSKRAERSSGRLPSKLRFTSPTFLSLQKNIKGKLLEKAFANINGKYSELFSAVEIEEKVKAEEEARRKLSGNSELEKRIEEDEIISKITNSQVVLPRLKKTLIELLKLEGRIGTYKDNFGINVKKGFAQKPPKALKIKKINTRVYKSVLNKIDLYKIAKKKGIDSSEEGALANKEPNVPSWRKLFSDVKSVPQNVTVAITKSKKDEEEQEQEIVPVVSNKVSEEDLSYRKMLGQLGDEFELIESYEKSPNGIPLQFKDGFESRKNNLSKIFTDLTGIETSKNKKLDINIKDDTEFQKLIDDVNGYKEPLTDEEHKKMEESLNEYYNREDVKAKIRDLQEKDVLSTFNQHMNDVLKAESKQNSEVAVMSVVDSEVETSMSTAELEKSNEYEKIKKGAEEQARMLHTLNNYIEARDKFEEEKREEERKERQLILDSAEEEARKIYDNNMILSGAEEEAKRIYNAQKADADKIMLDKMIKDSAEVEAQNIINDGLKIEEENKTQQMIIESAQEEAQRIIENEKKSIVREKELEEIKESANVEAQRLNELNKVVSGADEQARMIYEKDLEAENKFLKEGAEAQAALINDKSLIDKSVYEQAKQLQKNNEHLDILESAEVQARILFSQDKKNRLLKDAEELRRKLKSIDEEASMIDKSIAGYVESDEMDNSIGSAGKSTIIKTDDAYFDTEIINSAEMEARRLNDLNLIADSVEIEAQRLNDINMIIDGAEEEAQRLSQKNLFDISAEVEARRINDLNMIADSAEKEAQRLNDLNMIADSAEVEARRIYDNSKNNVVENKNQSVVDTVTPVTQSAPVVQQVATETPNVQVVPVSKKQTISVNNIELLNNSDRYGELTNKSNALLIKQTRIDNINKRINTKVEPVNKKKEMLTSLKEELETGNYSFLQRMENTEEQNQSQIKAA